MLLSIIIFINVIVFNQVKGSGVSICKEFPEAIPNGTCITYPAEGFCAPVVGGQQVYFPNFIPGPLLDQVLTLDQAAIKLVELLQVNKGIVEDNCLTQGAAFICNSIYPQCLRANGDTDEGVPILSCQSYCDTFWTPCQNAFDAFFIAGIEALGQSISAFAFPQCGPGGTFTDDPQPPDVFGVRSIPGFGPFALGYAGQIRYPLTNATFRFQNDTSIIVDCKTPPTATISAPLDLAALGLNITCLFPLIADENGDCVIPCPFPIIPDDQQVQIGLAFVVPAFIALFLCLFVFTDSLFVIAESQGFNELWRKRKRLLKLNNTSTNNDLSEDGTSGTGQNSAAKSGSRRRRNALRAATLYSLLGAVLCIIYFFIGPMVTLIRGDEVSCGIDAPETNLLDVILGTADHSDSFCKAQRIAPFILQMIFNLILYAIVRVFMVVTDKARRLSRRQTIIFDVVLYSYCIGIPILFWIIASVQDGFSTDLIDFISQFSVNSAICVPRLFAASEVILIFLPFIITGIAITGLSYYIYMHLSTINQNVKGIEQSNKSSSAVALRLLMIRLSFLGIATFLILLVFISASATLMQAMAEFAPRFNDFFVCVSTQSATCQPCTVQLALMNEKFPPSSAFAAQIASMSAITLLFGGFFAAQSASRLYKEYQDGTLQIKLSNLWHGRPINLKTRMGETSFQSFSNNLQDGAKSFVPEVVSDSCYALWYGRLKKFRQSMRDIGRARGPVFRWQKGKPVPKPKKSGFGVAQAWTSNKSNLDKNLKWQGVVGVPESTADPTSWSSSNASFSMTPGHSKTKINSPNTNSSSNNVPAVQSAQVFGGITQDPSWGYSESKLSEAVQFKGGFDDIPQASLGKGVPPKLPDL